MGLSPFRNCGTNYGPPAPAPNPGPDRWVLLDAWVFEHAYVLRVRYLDATNFEGVKVMVYLGKYRPRKKLDPHFQPGRLSPIARFRPDAAGIAMAKALAGSLRPGR